MKLIKFDNLKKFFNCLINTLILLLLCLNLYTIFAKNVFHIKYPTIMGYYSAVVVSGSMSGSIEVDDMVITQKQSEYRVSDIITFVNSGTAVTHRIIGIAENGYRTKGDANKISMEVLKEICESVSIPVVAIGEPVKYDSIVGKVVFVIPKIGKAVSFLSSPFGIMCLIFSMILFIKLPKFFENRNNVQNKVSVKRADEVK